MSADLKYAGEQVAVASMVYKSERVQFHLGIFLSSLPFPSFLFLPFLSLFPLSFLSSSRFHFAFLHHPLFSILLIIKFTASQLLARTQINLKLIPNVDGEPKIVQLVGINHEGTYY